MMKIHSVAVICLYENDKNILKLTVSGHARDVFTIYAKTIKLFFTNVKTMKHFIKLRNDMYFI